MKCINCFCLLFTLITLAFSANSASKEHFKLTELVNSNKVEYGAITTPFGIFVTRNEGLWGKSSKSNIVVIDPETFSQKLVTFSLPNSSDSDPFYDKTRRRLCFVSTRPVSTNKNENLKGDIWCVDRKLNSWADPYRLAEPVNSIAREYSPVFDDAGHLYFASDREGGFGQGDIYSAIGGHDGTWKVSNMGSAINTQYGEWNVGIRPDGKALFVEASGRRENLSIPGDLYYSEFIEGKWSVAIATSRINTVASDLMARWQNDGSILYASARQGNGDVDHYVSFPPDWLPIVPSLVAVSRSRAEIVLLDPKGLEVKRKIKVGIGTHEIAFSDDGRVAFAPSFGIYPAPHKEPIDHRPRFITEPSEGLAIVDLASGDVRNVQIDDCERPHGVATDNQASKFWITCEEEGTIAEYETKTLQHKRRFHLGIGVHKVSYAQDVLIASNPDTGQIYRIDLKTGGKAKITTGKGAEGFVISPDNQTLWVTNSQDATVCKIEIKTMATKWCRDTGGAFPIALVLLESNNELWVSRLATSDIAIFSSNTGEQVDTFDLTSGALGLTVNRDESRIYATLPRHNQVIAIDAISRKVIATSNKVEEGDLIKLVR